MNLPFKNFNRYEVLQDGLWRENIFFSFEIKEKKATSCRQENNSEQGYVGKECWTRLIHLSEKFPVTLSAGKSLSLSRKKIRICRLYESISINRNPGKGKQPIG